MTTRFTDTYKGPGDVLTLAAPYTRTAGQGALVGGIFGVALNDVTSAADGEFMTRGEFALEKTSAQAWAVGDRIYWNNSTKLCDSDSAAGRFVGVCTVAAANPTSTGRLVLVPMTELLEGPQATIAAVATADSDATYGAAESTLLNEIKTQLNLVIAALKTAGIIDAA